MSSLQWAPRMDYRCWQCGVITDPAERALPASAVAAMRPNGTTNIVAHHPFGADETA